MQQMIRYLLPLFFSLVLAAEWGTSFSVRTPNDATKPLDYELSIKFEDTEGNFQYLIKRDWERELGDKYVDDVLNFQHKALGHIDYITYNIGATIDWFKAGAAFKEVDGKIEPMLNLGVYAKADIKDLDNNPNITYIISVTVKSNFLDNNIFNIKSEVKKWLTPKINIFGLYKHEYYNEKEDFQFKVGLGVKL